MIGACESFTSFPATHTGTVTSSSGQAVASFDGADSLGSTGFYNFGYTVEVEEGNEISRVHVSGKASATCTADNTI